MMEIEAVEKTIMQSVLKSVMDYNSSIEMLEPAVRSYFNSRYVCCTLTSWKLIGDGHEIEITYNRLGLITSAVGETDTIPTETIVSIAVDLSLNKRL